MAQNGFTRRPGQAGFTLIEFMVALTVFALGVLGLAVTFMHGTRHVGTSGAQTQAVELAQQGLEDLLTLSYDDPALTSGAHDDADNPIAGAYDRSWTVEDDDPMSGCKTVTMTVAWPHNDPQHDVVLVAITTETGR
jgi:type IV pilus assembly protein PilV